MNHKAILGTLAFVAAGASNAQQGVCQKLEEIIRADEKTLAAESIGGIGDNSAPRETNRQLRIANAWASISANMVIMQNARCTPITRPIGPQTYLSAALKCQTDSIRSGGSVESCKHSEWKPD